MNQIHVKSSRKIKKIIGDIIDNASGMYYSVDVITDIAPYMTGVGKHHIFPHLPEFYCTVDIIEAAEYFNSQVDACIAQRISKQLRLMVDGKPILILLGKYKTLQYV